MASENRGYWSRSWQLLTRDEGWIKPLLVLGAARLVPIVGSFGADGYGLEWARLTAWGVDSSPKQKNVDTSACIRTGARAFVVSLGYLIVLGFARNLFRTILGVTLGGILAAVLGVFGGVIITVAELHSAIYQSIGAGYQIPRIIEMTKRDYRGLLRIAGMWALISLVFSLAFSMLLGGATVLRAGDILLDLAGYLSHDYGEEWLIANTVLSLLGRMAPILCLLVYAATVATSFQSLMVTTATGLWMRQFDVANWGEDNEPLPQTDAAPSDGYRVTTMPASTPYHAPASEPDASAAVQEVPMPVDTPSEVPAPERDASIPEPVAAAEVVQTFDLDGVAPEAVPEANAEDAMGQEAEPDAQGLEGQDEERQDDEQAALASLDAIEDDAEPAAEVEARAPEVPTFSLNEPVAQACADEPAGFAADVPQTDEDALLAQVNEAIHEADLTVDEEAPAAPETIELDVPGASHDEPERAEETEDRIVEVIDLSAGHDEDDAQA